MKSLALWFAILVSPAALAGTVGGGGGVVWKCPSGVYLADAAEFAMLHPTGRRGVGFVETSDSKPNILDFIASGGIDFIADRLSLIYRGLGDSLKGRERQLIFQATQEQLPLLNDDKLPLEMTINNQHCIKAQLAIQNFETVVADRVTYYGVVTYNEPLFKALSSADKVLFRAHEALVSLQKNQFGSTAPIRLELMEAIIGNFPWGVKVFPGFSGKINPYVGQIWIPKEDGYGRMQPALLTDDVPVNSSTFKKFKVELQIGPCSFRQILASIDVSIDESGNYKFLPTPYNLFDKNPDFQAADDDGRICVQLMIYDKDRHQIRFGNPDKARKGMIYNQTKTPSADEVQSLFGQLN